MKCLTCDTYDMSGSVKGQCLGCAMERPIKPPVTDSNLSRRIKQEVHRKIITIEYHTDKIKGMDSNKWGNILGDLASNLTGEEGPFSFNEVIKGDYRGAEIFVFEKSEDRLKIEEIIKDIMDDNLQETVGIASTCDAIEDLIIAARAEHED